MSALGLVVFSQFANLARSSEEARKEEWVMKRLLAVTFMLATAYSALAQTNASKSTGGEPPWDVRNSRARLVGHFNNPAQMRRLSFALATPHPDQEEQFLRELMTPGSPQFHKFLTPDQWIARFGPAVADEQAVVDWATGQGFTVTHRFPNRLIVSVEAPIGTIEKALQVTINRYQMDGYTYFANERAPVLPAGLAGVIRNVEGLHNFPVMRPAYSHGPIPPGAIYNPGPAVGPRQTQHADGDRAKYEQARAASHANGVHPNITNSLYDPSDIYAANAYNYDALQNQGHCCNPNNDPGGSPPQASIAIAAFGNLIYTGSFSPHANFTDILGFQAQYPYLAFNITAETVDGGPGFCSPEPCSQDEETTLDTEWSLATANSFGSYLDTAQVFLYEGEGGYPGSVFNTILTEGNARVMTSSFACGAEDQCSSGEISSMHSVFNSMAGEGWTMMVASGDQGATSDCTLTTGTLSVQYPGSDPDIVGVGGTTLFSGGASGVFTGEIAWTGGTKAGSCAFPTNNGGSTGGCSTVFGVPAYQIGSNATCGTQRGVPDISLNANFGQNIFWNGKLIGVGGTSIASPMMAGFFAQEGAYLQYLTTVTGNDCGSFHIPCEPVGGGMGIGNYYLYYFGTNPSYAPHYPFYDITFGCNSNDITALLSLTPYCAGPGYDLVTGWGTINALQLGWAINSYIAGDASPPAVNFTGAVAGKWYNVPPTVNWNISGTTGNGAVPNGVAGFSQTLDFDPGDPTLGSRASTNTSYFSGPENPNATTGSLTQTTIGCHTANVRAWDNGGTSSNNTFAACYDPVPPTVVCGTADGLWHANNVSIACNAADSISGLAVASDASFNLTTSVAAGTETNNACTGSHVVYDNAGNSATGGPVCGNMVDRTPPVITITQPTATTYTHSSTLTLSYTVTDTGSGVGTVTPTMNGSGTVGGSTIVNGLAINLLTALPLGPNTFAITAFDKVLNKSSASVVFTITVTPASIINDVTQLQASGAITMNTNPLLAKLQNALTYETAGDCADAVDLYGAFINLVMAQTGKGITPAAAAILIADAQYLEANCP
jgi:kumamolisin